MRLLTLSLICCVSLAQSSPAGDGTCLTPACNACDAASCDSLLDGCDSYGCGGLLGGLIKPSDHCFDDFISPMTNPLFFEDPRTLTEARFIYVHHDIPNALMGGNVDVVALHLRAALSDNLSFIATKDGFIFSDNPLLNDGWADVSAGLKYNVWKDAAAQSIVSVGTTFDFPIGSTRALQGTGDGEFHLFASAGTEFLDHFHFVSGSGFRLPVNTNEESQVWYWSNHVDWMLGNGLYLFGETNWYHWLRSGRSFPLPVEGLDLINLGSIGVAGNDIATGAIGVKFKPKANMEIGVAYEMPMTDRKDILQDRFTFDLIVRY